MIRDGKLQAGARRDERAEITLEENIFCFEEKREGYTFAMK